MVRKTRLHVTLATACVAAAGLSAAGFSSAEAQTWAPPTPELYTNGPQTNYGDQTQSMLQAQQNVVDSARYESVVHTNPEFRAQRIAQECGPLTEPDLYRKCVASFGPPPVTVPPVVVVRPTVVVPAPRASFSGLSGSGGSTSSSATLRRRMEAECAPLPDPKAYARCVASFVPGQSAAVTHRPPAGGWAARGLATTERPLRLPTVVQPVPVPVPVPVPETRTYSPPYSYSEPYYYGKSGKSDASSQRYYEAPVDPNSGQRYSSVRPTTPAPAEPPPVVLRPNTIY